MKWLRGDKRWERRPLKNRKRCLIPLDETLLDDLQRDARAAGIGKVTVHELRHTAGSLLLQAGKTMTTVSKILGHSSVRVTDKIYAGAFDEDKRNGVAAVTERLPIVEQIASERAIPQQTVRKPVRTQKNTESR